MIFTVNNLSAGYGGEPCLENISFSVREGEVFGILGSNGSGKTTLIKAICNILPHKGSCVLSDVPLESLPPKEIAKKCSYIPQRSGISIDMSVFDVVLMGFNPQLGLFEYPCDKMKEKAREALKKVRLTGFENNNYQNLSEGQKQLCILARTLVTGAQLLLLDEPESSLDFKFRYNMMGIISRLAKDERKSVIITLHDPTLALNFCDRLLILKEGKVQGIISPKTNSIKETQNALKAIYGPVSLTKCTNNKGREFFVMLTEQEDL